MPEPIRQVRDHRPPETSPPEPGWGILYIRYVVNIYLHYVVEFGVKSPLRAARDRYSGLIPMTLPGVGEDLLIGLESFGHLGRCRAARRDAVGPPCSVQRKCVRLRSCATWQFRIGPSCNDMSS